jgi:hypothetical protein
MNGTTRETTKLPVARKRIHTAGMLLAAAGVWNAVAASKLWSLELATERTLRLPGETPPTSRFLEKVNGPNDINTTDMMQN